MADNEAILLELLAMQKETNERNTKMEVHMQTFATYKDMLEKKIVKQEELLEKLGSIISQHEKISEVVNNINIAISNQNKRLDSLEKQNKTLEEKITSLEMAPAKKAYTIIGKIAWIIIPVFITSICSWLMVKMGLSIK